MSKIIDVHLAAIRAGEVTKTSVIGLRKAITAANKRRDGGWSVSRTQAKVDPRDLDTACDELERIRPRVTGELHDSGVKQLQAKRYRRQLASVADIVAGITEFRLVDFDLIGTRGLYATPIYEARDAAGRGFRFINVPWQSGGNGPEIV